VLAQTEFIWFVVGPQRLVFVNEVMYFDFQKVISLFTIRATISVQERLCIILTIKMILILAMIPFTLSVHHLPVYFPKWNALKRVILAIKTSETFSLGITYFMSFFCC
jgi:hypothetical protein